MTRKRRVGILCGGRSGEHEVSVASARSVMAAIDRDKYDVVPIGITRDGQWITSSDVLEALGSGQSRDRQPVALLADPSCGGLVRLDDREASGRSASSTALDVVFPVLHGTYGEDGTVQGLLELAGIPYVGAGVLGSAVGLDKTVFKDVVRAHGLPIVDYLAFTRRQWLADPETLMDRIEGVLSYPIFVKPANLGSSVGISKCRDRAGLGTGLAEAARYDRKLVAETAVPGAREIEVSVLGNDDPIASVPGEVVPSREFYSYEAKYLDAGDFASQLLIPAPIDDDVTQLVRELAIRAYKAIDCAGMARVDFLFSDETGTLYVNELNTIPGFTSISMYPKLWEASGLPYDQLIDRLIELAFERFEDRNRCETRYRIAG